MKLTHCGEDSIHYNGKFKINYQIAHNGIALLEKHQNGPYNIYTYIYENKNSNIEK